jgi:DNA-binding transcriptional LysR family regulator
MSTQPANAVNTAAMELEWSDLSVLLAVCRAGSLSGAARALGQNHSTIFRRVNAIEAKTGVRFFERLPEGYAMTDAGQSALRYGERIEAEVQALGREVLGQDMRLQGKIRVTAPEGMMVQILPRLFVEFHQAHPDVTIEFIGATSALDLARREADVAVRATMRPPDSSLGRKVCDFRFSVYSSPMYLEQNKDKPLAEQSWCLISGIVDWLVPHVWKKKSYGERQVVFSSSASLAVQNAAAEGMGFTLLPCYLGDTDPRLVQVGEPVEALKIELWVLTHPDLRHTARVKALIAFLYEALLREKDFFEGTKPGNKTRTRK